MIWKQHVFAMRMCLPHNDSNNDEDAEDENHIKDQDDDSHWYHSPNFI